MEEPDHAKIAQAIGTDLCEHYADTLTEGLPTHLTELLAYIAVVQAIGPGYVGDQRADPSGSTEPAYDQAIEMAAQCMVTVARADDSTTAGQAWLLKALRLRGELTDGNGVDRTIARTVLEEVVELAVAKSIEELPQDAREHSGG